MRSAHPSEQRYAGFADMSMTARDMAATDHERTIHDYAHAAHITAARMVRHSMAHVAEADNARTNAVIARQRRQVADAIYWDDAAKLADGAAEHLLSRAAEHHDRGQMLTRYADRGALAKEANPHATLIGLGMARDVALHLIPPEPEPVVAMPAPIVADEPMAPTSRRASRSDQPAK